MKTITILFLSLILSIHSYCQNSEIIKKEIDQLFFYIPMHADKYDVRKALQLNNNFSRVEYVDWAHCFSADFNNQPLLKYIGEIKEIHVWIDTVQKKSDTRKLSFEYYPDDLKNCDNQLKDIFNLYKPISYKAVAMTVNNWAKEKSGEGYWFYSNKVNYEKRKSYLDVSYRYIDESKEGGKSFYLFEIIFNENNL